MTGPNGNALSPVHVLADRLEQMRERNGNNVYDMLHRQVQYGELSYAQAANVRAELRRRATARYR